MLLILNSALSQVMKRDLKYIPVRNRNVSLDFKNDYFIISYKMDMKDMKKCLSKCNQNSICTMVMVERITDDVIACNLYQFMAADYHLRSNTNTTIHSIYQLPSVCPSGTWYDGITCGILI